MSTFRIGIDLGGTKIEGVVMDAEGQVLKRERIASPSHSYRAVIDAIAELVNRLQQQVGADDSALIGVGTPGSWVARQRAMKNCNSTVLNGQPLLLDLAQLLGPRVRIANDANCFALSEAIDGAGADAATVFGVILGTGVGGGLVVDRKVLPGANSNGGEWGHTPLAYFRHAARASAHSSAIDHMREQLADRTCYCGRLNCVETFLSGPGLQQIADEILGEPLTAQELFATAGAQVSGDVALVQALYCDLLASSLAQVLNVFDPQVVVLGGGLSAQPMLYEQLPKLLPHYLFNSESVTQSVTQILPPTHGDSSGVRGAAWLW